MSCLNGCSAGVLIDMINKLHTSFPYQLCEFNCGYLLTMSLAVVEASASHPTLCTSSIFAIISFNISTLYYLLRRVTSQISTFYTHEHNH